MLTTKPYLAIIYVNREEAVASPAAATQMAWALGTGEEEHSCRDTGDGSAG
jgi:hypothetical protein